MASALPHQPPVDHAPSERMTVELAVTERTNALEALASGTAREILDALGDGPGTASDLADDVGRSLQSVSYHLERLCDAELIAPVDTWYSAKGTEMTVYGLAAERLVVEFDAAADRPPRRSPEVER